ncbi:hypothetical protein T439DRAFT_376781 [Meredithblackwellia eburnea MCA 4105]
MGKAVRANSKKASSSTSSSKKKAAVVDNEAPLFEIDTQGSSSVRHSLLHSFTTDNAAQPRLRKGTSFTKPLKSDQILAVRSSVPAMTGRKVPSTEVGRKKDSEKRKHIDKETRERLKRLAGRAGKGEGLWGVKDGEGNAREEGLKKLNAVYDAWKVEEVEELKEDEDEAMKKYVNEKVNGRVPKAPSTLHQHSLLSSSFTPSAILLPHPGTSYNPSQEAHQSLLRTALTHYTAVEEREERAVPVKEAMDAVRGGERGRELWEMYEDEVGSGEEDEAEEGEDGVTEPSEQQQKKKQTKRKTRQQRNATQRHSSEQKVLALRRASRALAASTVHAKSVLSSITSSQALSLEEKAAALKLQKTRLATNGLTRFRSGPSKVPAAAMNFQLGEELSEDLRTLKPEGNLWREWLGSNMRRGRIGVERANEGFKRAGKGGRGRDKGSKLKEVDKYTYKFAHGFREGQY